MEPVRPWLLASLFLWLLSSVSLSLKGEHDARPHDHYFFEVAYNKYTSKHNYVSALGLDTVENKSMLFDYI